MVAHKNFYETAQEARMRLRNTVVKYKDDFYYVIEVGDHMLDGKFRVYMDELGHGRVGVERHSGFPSSNDWVGPDLCGKYDTFIDNIPNSGFIRKYADSRHFEKFRPFPLGNVNRDGGVVYTERTPTRDRHQGLRQEAVLCTKVRSVPSSYDPHQKRPKYSLSPDFCRAPIGNSSVDFLGEEFYATLLGEYPSYEEVVYNLRDPAIMNEGCAFHREYSILRGPLDTLILCYKHNGVGIIDNDNSVTVGSTHEFLKEELYELGVFSEVKIKEVLSDA